MVLEYIIKIIYVEVSGASKKELVLSESSVNRPQIGRPGWHIHDKKGEPLNVCIV